MHNRNISTSHRILERVPIENISKYDKIEGSLDVVIQEPTNFEQVFNAEPSEQGKIINTSPVVPKTSHWNLLHGVTLRDKYTPLKAQEYFWSWWFNRPSQCKCADAFNYLESMGGLRFDTEKDFFESGIQFHNLINKKLQLEQPGMVYDQISLEEAYSMWKAIFPHRHKVAVVTIATGQDYKLMLRYSGTSHKKYAERIGADYIQLTNQLYNQWQFEKFRATTVTSSYDKTIFVDADVFITDNCPDISVYDKVVIHDDIHKQHNIDWLIEETKQVAASQNIESWYPTRCLNSGFFMATRETNPWVLPKERLPDTHCSEQIWVDKHINDYIPLPTHANWQYWMPDFWQGLKDATVIHLANAPNKVRINMLKDLSQSVDIDTIIDKYTNGTNN